MSNKSSILSWRTADPTGKSIVRAFVAALMVAAVAVRSAFAAAPATGTVVEGVSVPGVALGDSRAQVEAAWGPPQACQSVEEIGDMASCRFEIDNGGDIFVRYRASDGGPASNSPDDVVVNVRWYELVSGWTTTAGINTTLALADPDAVLAAYPDATVVTQSMFDWHIVDTELGIRVSYHTNYLSGVTTVSMDIFNPYTPQPPEQDFTRVTEIELSGDKRFFTAAVRVQDQNGLNVFGATVTATWNLPNGDQAQVSDQTDGFGRVTFSLKKSRKGDYVLTIDDVVLEGYQFDRESSLLSASISK